eukprot:scaffold12630_cov118-Isochrysis_galbana.AAC.5
MRAHAQPIVARLLLVAVSYAIAACGRQTFHSLVSWPAFVVRVRRTRPWRCAVARAVHVHGLRAEAYVHEGDTASDEEANR